MKSKSFLILSMFIFGTIGIFRKYIPIPSSMLALTRGVIGVLFLLLVVLLRKEKLSLNAIKKNFWLLFISGAMIGFNWILLFEAYNYTTVATATLCYYMAPIFVILVSPLLFREKLTLQKGICVVMAIVGMIFVSGVLQSGTNVVGELGGILLGLGAAVLYASVIVMNKKITGIGAYDKTILQLGASAIVLIPYVLLTEDVRAVEFNPQILILLLIVGVVHTGIAYVLYFGSIEKLNTQTVALFSYIDPVVAIILSALLLRENIGITGVIGAVLILGSTLSSELPGITKK